MVTVLFIILAWFLMQSSTFIFSFYMNAAPTEQLGAVGAGIPQAASTAGAWLDHFTASQ